jgi:hypothetical protein
MDTIQLIQILTTELVELSNLLSVKRPPEFDQLMHSWFTDLMQRHVRTVFFFRR